MLGPKINHRLFFNSARDVIFKKLEELDSTLEGGCLPSDREIYKLGTDIFQDMERGDSSLEFLSYLVCERWAPPEEPNASWSEMVRSRLQRAMQGWWTMQDEQDAALKAQREAEARKRRAASVKRREEEGEAKAKRENEAKMHDQIAREFGITKRHARTVRGEGTRDPARAQRLAAITGEDPSRFLKKGRRKRETDLVKMFMTAEHGFVSFTHFVSDPDEKIDDDTIRRFLKENSRKLSWGEDLDSLEALVNRLRDLNYPLTLDAAENLWKAYKLWRIRTISSIAIYDVEDGR